MTINTIIDLHGGRSLTEDMATVKAAGVIAMIHKATQGLTYVDSEYLVRRTGAIAQGILWGCYHFATSDDPIAQADHFLDTAKPDAKTLVALDLEENPNGSSMTLAQAEAFVQHVWNRLQRYPVLYTTAYVLEALGWNGAGELLNCPLWVAGYGPPPPRLPKGWDQYTLWQYTNGTDGPPPHRFPGLSNTYDREQFNGSSDDLVAFWGK